MSLLQDEFDPLAVVGDWLDACRWGEIDALLSLYDERATMECDCEHVSLSGRKWIAAYWAPKLGTCVQPQRHGTNSRWGSARLQRRRRQIGPNELPLWSLGQDTAHKLRSIILHSLKRCGRGLAPPHRMNADAAWCIVARSWRAKGSTSQPNGNVRGVNRSMQAISA